MDELELGSIHSSSVFSDYDVLHLAAYDNTEDELRIDCRLGYCCRCFLHRNACDRAQENRIDVGWSISAYFVDGNSNRVGVSVGERTASC